jgi:teichuronic acid exporter
MATSTTKTSKGSITQKLMHGSFWNALSQFGGQAVNLVIMLVLARLLSPKDFGLIGMVSVFIGFIGYFTEFGLGSSIVRKKEVDDLDLNTAFWSSIALALALYVLVFFLSPLVELFYKQKSITGVMRWLFVALVIRSFGFVHSAIETKNLRYKKLSLAFLISAVLSGGLGMVLALMKFGVWSLVAMQIAADTFQIIIYYWTIKWRPSFAFSKQRFRELFGFGAHIAINNSIKALSENVDQILLGRQAGASPLGIYAMAHRLCRYPLEKLWAIFGKMLFPAFSTIQDDPERLRRTIVKISLAGAYVIVPFLLLLLLGARQVTAIFLGNKWTEVIPILRIFAIYIFIAGISFGDESLMFAINKVKQVNIVKVATPICICLIGFFAVKHYGIAGMAWTLAIVTAVGAIAMKAILFRHLRLPLREFAKKLAPVALYAAICGVSSALIHMTLRNLLPALPYLLVLGAAVGGSATLFLWKFKVLKTIKE